MSGRDVGRDLDGITDAICSYAKVSYSQTFSGGQGTDVHFYDHRSSEAKIRRHSSHWSSVCGQEWSHLLGLWGFGSASVESPKVRSLWRQKR